MTRQEAWQKDSELITSPEENSGLWRVQGNHSGYTYKDSMTEEKALAYAAELNKNKTQYKYLEEIC
jgi:hypothetical protein